MTRRLIAACVALGLIFGAAAPAQASLRHFHGNVRGGGSIDFDVLFRNGQPKKAGNFDFGNVPVDCQPSNTQVNFSTANVVPIVDRNFVYEFRGFTAKVNGRVKRGGKVAFGKIDYGPNDLDSTARSGCTTNGRRPWTAHL